MRTSKDICQGYNACRYSCWEMLFYIHIEMIINVSNIGWGKAIAIVIQHTHVWESVLPEQIVVCHLCWDSIAIDPCIVCTYAGIVWLHVAKDVVLVVTDLLLGVRSFVVNN